MIRRYRIRRTLPAATRPYPRSSWKAPASFFLRHLVVGGHVVRHGEAIGALLTHMREQDSAVPQHDRLLRLSVGRVDGGQDCGEGAGDGVDSRLVGDQSVSVNGVAV